VRVLDEKEEWRAGCPGARAAFAPLQARGEVVPRPSAVAMVRSSSIGRCEKVGVQRMVSGNNGNRECGGGKKMGKPTVHARNVSVFNRNRQRHVVALKVGVRCVTRCSHQ